MMQYRSECFPGFFFASPSSPAIFQQRHSALFAGHENHVLRFLHPELFVFYLCVFNDAGLALQGAVLHVLRISKSHPFLMVR
jgi:hypothetical protein